MAMSLVEPVMLRNQEAAWAGKEQFLPLVHITAISLGLLFPEVEKNRVLMKVEPRGTERVNAALWGCFQVSLTHTPPHPPLTLRLAKLH